jgi:hypothetical protein
VLARAIIVDLRPEAVPAAVATLSRAGADLVRHDGFRGAIIVRDAELDQLLVVSLLADEDGAALEPALLASLTGQPLHDGIYRVALAAGQLGGVAARVIVPDLVPGSVNAIIGLFRNAVMLAATAQNGFHGGLLLVNDVQEDVLSIGLWESFEALHASEAAGYLREQVAQFAEFLARPPAPRNGEVILVIAPASQPPES